MYICVDYAQGIYLQNVSCSNWSNSWHSATNKTETAADAIAFQSINSWSYDETIFCDSQYSQITLQPHRTNTDFMYYCFDSLAGGAEDTQTYRDR